MDSFSFWKKLNTIVKSSEPIKTARCMLDAGDITMDEMSWALVALATLPIAMVDVLEKK